MHRNNLQCRFGCTSLEDQKHTFQNCAILNSIHIYNRNIHYEDIFGDVTKQVQVIMQETNICSGFNEEEKIYVYM